MKDIRTRNAAVDTLRALSVLYIIGFWHLLEYAPTMAWRLHPIFDRLTVVVLSLFVLISGYLIGRSKAPVTGGEVRRFYASRLLRIYPPYLLALLCFYLLGSVSGSIAAKGAVLVSMMAPPPPQTLWFITMLMMFYLLAPLLLIAHERSFGLLISVAALLGLLVAYRSAIGNLDPRTLIYLPPFAAGIYLARHLNRASSVVLGILLAGSVAALAFSLSRPGSAQFSLASVPLALFAPAAIFIAAHGRLASNRAIQQLSYASFFAYLFHRPIYAIMTSPPFQNSAPSPVIYLVLVCLPAAIVFGWIGQKNYDRLVTSTTPVVR
jgi:peptidoglycan/LPS O-acetylase OafA/YrhL